MGTGAIVAIVIVAVVSAIAVPLRIAVAKQRRGVESARARLAAARNVRRRAEGVAIEVLQKIGASSARVSRTATCALAEDGFYCLGDDGRWGARVRFAPGAPAPGDVVLATAPCLVKGGTAAGDRADWLVPVLASLPSEGVLLQFEGDLAWYVAVSPAEEWFAALKLMLGKPGGPA